MRRLLALKLGITYNFIKFKFQKDRMKIYFIPTYKVIHNPLIINLICKLATF